MPSAKRNMAVASLGLTITIFSQLSAALASPAAAPSGSAVLSSLQEVGCFDSSSGLTSLGTYTYQSQTWCQQQCVDKGNTISAVTNGDTCLCGNTIPPKSSKQSDDSQCSKTCQGWPDATCGGDGFFQVFYATDNTNVAYASGGSSSSSSAASSSPPSSPTTQSSSKGSSSASQTTGPATIITSVSPGKTVIITQSAVAATNAPATTSADKSSKGGSNTAGIAAGVVVGIVVVAGLIGAGYFFWRRRQRQMQHQQMPDYNGHQSPMSYAPGSAGADSRLNHDAMAHRRMSDGSIADNEDYSRRILKVTNPDDR